MLNNVNIKETNQKKQPPSYLLSKKALIAISYTTE